MTFGDDIGGAFGQLLGLGKSWRVVEARLDSLTSRFVLKVEETSEL